MSQRARQFELWPKYKKAYIDALDRGLKAAAERGHERTWQDGHTGTPGSRCFEWWIDG